MKVIIAGSRNADATDLQQALTHCDWKHLITAVVSGTARGIDQAGEAWAAQEGLAVHRYPADWRRYGRSAGPRRNRQMAAAADGLIAVWDGKSRGTRSMIDAARSRGLRTFVWCTDT